MENLPTKTPAFLTDIVIDGYHHPITFGRLDWDKRWYLYDDSGIFLYSVKPEQIISCRVAQLVPVPTPPPNRDWVTTELINGGYCEPY